jgi:hypothetical protein
VCTLDKFSVHSFHMMLNLYFTKLAQNFGYNFELQEL